MHGRTWIAAVGAFVALAMCAEPTQIRVEVFTEVPCDKRAIVGLAAAATPEAVTREPFTSTSTACDPTTRRVGAMVLQPSGDADDSVVIQIVTRDDAEPAEQCLDVASRCIVARRKIRFAPNETRPLRVDLRLSCLGVVCDPTTTCVQGQCSSINVPEACEGECDESRLGLLARSPEADASLLDASDAAPPTDAPIGDAVTAGLTWGRFASNLALPECQVPESGPPVLLTVNTVDDELDGNPSTLVSANSAGPKMSLREALYIASNIRNGTRVVFDPVLFPIDGETTITLDERPMPNLVDVCVDARGVGVNVAWKPGITESTGPLCVWTVAAGSRQLGLQLAPPVKQRVAGGATVAGCRYDSGYIPIEATNGIIGPWNAFVRAAFAFTQVDTASVGIVKSNWFGFDPLGRVGSGQVQQALLLRGATEVADNVIVANIGVGLIGTTAANIHGNFLGMNFDQTPLGGLNIAIDANGGAIVGPGNRIRGAFGNAVNVTSASPVRITQNSITGNGGGIVSAGPLPQLPPAPTITKVTATDVSGTCSQTGTVEVFTDPGNQGETYVASAPCEAGGSPWAVTAPQALPSGRNVTATLTESTLFRTSGFSKPTAIP